MIAMKSIKPARFRADVFRQNIIAESNAFAKDAIKEYDKTTKTWKGNKPTFEYLSDIDSIGVGVIIDPGGNAEGIQKWTWLDKGTRKNYPIPKPGNTTAKTLRFNSGFYAKTFPHVIGSVGGGSFGPTVFRKRVIHPGIEAREWDRAIATLMSPRYKARMETAMRTGAKQSGHGKK